MTKAVENLIYEADIAHSKSQQLDCCLEVEINNICNEPVLFIGYNQHNTFIVTFSKDKEIKTIPVYYLFELHDKLQRKITFKDIPA